MVCLHLAQFQCNAMTNSLHSPPPATHLQISLWSTVTSWANTRRKLSLIRRMWSANPFSRSHVERKVIRNRQSLGFAMAFYSAKTISRLRIRYQVTLKLLPFISKLLPFIYKLFTIISKRVCPEYECYDDICFWNNILWYLSELPKYFLSH